jgi:hypothetical protein
MAMLCVSASEPLLLYCCTGQARYLRFVVTHSIRDFNRAVPFVPYGIHMASRERYEVPHPDFISISPRGSFVIVIDEVERHHHLKALLIERASPLDGQK